MHAFVGPSKIQRNQLLEAAKRRMLQKRPPIALVQGQYGSGKTHLIMNIISSLQDADEVFGMKIKAPYIKTPDLPSRAVFLNYFSAIMTELSREFIVGIIKRGVEKAIATGGDKALLEMVKNDEDLYRVAKYVYLQEDTLEAWRWLSGVRISSSERSKLNVRSHIDSTEKAVNLLFTLGEISKEHFNTMIILLADEIEFLNVLRPDSQRTFENAFRLLFGRSNNTVGLIMAAQAGTREDLSPFLRSDAVYTRIQEQNVVQIKNFDEKGALDFLLELVRQLRKEEEISAAVDQLKSESGRPDVTEEWYPLTERGARVIVAKAGRRPPILARDLCEKFSDALSQAILSDSPIVDENVVNQLPG